MNISTTIPFTPDILLKAYCHGFFPMGDPETGEIHWFRPDTRTIIPLDKFHISRSLNKELKKKQYSIKINNQFEKVMYHCMDRKEGSWINEKMIQVYLQIHKKGYAHSVEVYKNGKLGGGLYGVSINGVFCGESMFHLQSNCSKIALCELVFRMRERKMGLLDAQFSNPFLEQFNIERIADSIYYQKLQWALSLPVSFL